MSYDLTCPGQFRKALSLFRNNFWLFSYKLFSLSSPAFLPPILRTPLELTVVIEKLGAGVTACALHPANRVPSQTPHAASPKPTGSKPCAQRAAQ